MNFVGIKEQSLIEVLGLYLLHRKERLAFIKGMRKHQIIAFVKKEKTK